MNSRPGKTDYASALTPEGYRCAGCGAAGVKLWRQYNTFLDHIDLYCVDCAVRDQGVETTVGEDGRRESAHGLTDQIGNLVPAVPDEEGETFWGYTSVPQAGVAWWRQLPLRR
jgi:hypothetical protein